MRTSYSTEQRRAQGTNRTTSTRTAQARWRSSFSHVGRGSDKHCLSGRACTISMTSVCVTGMKRRSSQPTGAGGNRGPLAPAVAARTPATLSLKNWWRADASMSEDRGVLPRPSSLSNDRQSWRGCECWASIRLDQNADLLSTAQMFYF